MEAGNMRLRVQMARKEEVYRDIVRIPEPYRLDESGEVIPEGQVRRITVGKKCAFVILRGDQESTETTISMGEVTRNKLDLKCSQTVEVGLDRPLCRQYCEYRWAWGATEISYRVAAKLALTSVVLGVFGLVLGIFALCK
jgi:hypothetical protein